MAGDFYAVFGTVCFTLLGLWLVVVQTRYEDWVVDPAYRRMAYAVFLNFALPAAMSVLSLISPDNTLLWRTAFCSLAFLGAVSVAIAHVPPRREGIAAAIVGGGRWVAATTYVIVGLVALFPMPIGQAVGGLSGLEIESILLSVLVLLNLNVAWVLLMEA